METYINDDNNGRRRRGRPRLEDTITPMWKELMIQAGLEGKHTSEILGILNISWNGHYSLLERSKEYSQTYSEFLKHAETFWYNMAHNAMVENGGLGFNTKLWDTIMKNRFKENWKNERQIDVTTKGEKLDTDKTITIEIVKNKLDDTE